MVVQAEHPSLATRKRGTVVLVDDDAALRAAVSLRLQVEGYEVQALPSGEALLEAPPFAPEACLVIDRRLPGIDGMAALAALRARQVNNPALLITTITPSVAQQCAEAGVELLGKPLVGDALLHRIEALMG